MNRFAALIDRLATASSDEAEKRLIADYLATTPEPDAALAARILNNNLKARRVKLALIRGLAESRIDSTLFKLSLDYVGDVAETIALLWPQRHGANKDPSLSEIIEALSTLGRSELPKHIEAWLDACDTSGRWALIKLVTGTLQSSAKPASAAQNQSELFASDADRIVEGKVEAALLYVEQTNAKSSPMICSFGLWKDGTVVPVGKVDTGAFSEFIEDFAKNHTVKRFGPVREVSHTAENSLILEVTFKGLKHSRRHKSGLTLRDAQIIRVFEGQAQNIECLTQLLPARGQRA